MFSFGEKLLRSNTFPDEKAFYIANFPEEELLSEKAAIQHRQKIY